MVAVGGHGAGVEIVHDDHTAGRFEGQAADEFDQRRELLGCGRRAPQLRLVEIVIIVPRAGAARWTRRDPGSAGASR